MNPMNQHRITCNVMNTENGMNVHIYNTITWIAFITCMRLNMQNE